jgi:hypothetical protein
VSASPHTVDDFKSHQHVVQFYEADRALLAVNVARYLREGLLQGDGALVIATPSSALDLRRELSASGVDSRAASSRGRLIFLDAEQTLGRFMVNDHPDWLRFEAAIRGVIERLEPAAGLRAYGEMVGVLWKAGRFSAAIELEDHWNRLLHQEGFSLFCSYPIDVFDPEFQVHGVDALLCDHTHLLSTGENGYLEAAVHRAMDECLGSPAEEIRRRVIKEIDPAWGQLPPGEAAILWVRANLPREAENILTKAREYYKASQHVRVNRHKSC